MKRTYFANIYPPIIGACGSVYSTLELANQMAGRARIACVEFTFDPDQGEDDADENGDPERAA
jgi:hypothetical protein